LVDLVEDILEKKRAGEFVKEVNAVDSLESDLEFEQLPLPDNPQRTRAFLKIEDGCDQYCAYCIIPDARGPVRSLSPELVKEQLGELICAGYREVVLTGVHTSAYGKDLPVGINLAALLRDLVKMPGDFRIRLSSVEPVDVSEELLEVMASSPRICRHLHLPLQSGDDEILEMMQRPYTTADYSELFQKAIKMIPDLAVTTDVMVGFPGETDRHFENTYDFIASLPFRDLHVFKYSPRPGTPAAEMSGQVKPRNKDERSRRLRELADTKARAFAEGALGETLDVLVERSYKKRPGYWQGITDNYLRVIFPSQEKELRGELLPVRMIRLAEEDLIEGETSRGDGSCGRS
jgi:threonylcarbamoyladenosine tRNA methylthiotransferase MtaB